MSRPWRDTDAPPYPEASPPATPTRTPWLPTSVLAGVSSLSAGAFTGIRNAPVPSVEPVALTLMAGRTTVTGAFGSVVFAKTVNGPPGPTLAGDSVTVTGSARTASA